LLARYSGGSGGGHSVELVALRDKDYGGNRLPADYGTGPWIEMYNSWSSNWGYNGRALCSPDCIRQMLRARWTVMVGLYGVQPAVAPIDPQPLNP